MTAQTLIDAARTQKREDRLTELLAVVLDALQPAAIDLLRRVGIPAERAEVTTQVLTRRGKRVDMQVLALDEEGCVSGRLWSEHKTGAEYMPDQLEGYARDLSEFRGPTKLITIAERDVPRRLDPNWTWVTWDELGVWLDRIGRTETGTLPWRTAASRYEVKAEIMMLHELLSYLEEEHGVVLEPITPVDVVAFAKAHDAGERLTVVLERAAQESGIADPDRPRWDKNDWGLIWQKFEPTGWSRDVGGYPEILVANEDFWREDAVGEPAFGAGLTIQADLRDALLGADDGRWHRMAVEQGFSIHEESHVTRIYRTMYVTELIGVGPSIDEQANKLSAWLSQAVKDVNLLDPKLPAE